jgi:riboflavin synthase
MNDDINCEPTSPNRYKQTDDQKSSFRIGIADTMFARGDMGGLAEKTIREKSDHQIIRYTVPGVKDLPIACKLLFKDHNCDIVIACGYVGAEAVDKVCGHEASSAIQDVQLKEKKHIIEVFVHEDEGTDRKLVQIMHNRVVKHALNALELLKGPSALQEKAGSGERQGWANAKPLEIDNINSDPTLPKSYKIGIIVAEFNREITFGMRDRAIEYTKSLGHETSVLTVPGVFDMPLAIKKFCKDRSIDAIILLGAVIKGSTKHDETVANTTANAAVKLSVEFNKPITCGVIGPGATWEQADQRSNEYVKRSIDAALKMLEL